MPLLISELQHPVPIRHPNGDFAWLNYFDLDDPMGWPLRPLNPAYEEIVEDCEINASGTTVQEFVQGATPLSHQQYWRTPAFIEEVEKCLIGILDPLPQIMKRFLIWFDAEDGLELTLTFLLCLPFCFLFLPPLAAAQLGNTEWFLSGSIVGWVALPALPT